MAEAATVLSAKEKSDLHIAAAEGLLAQMDKRLADPLLTGARANAHAILGSHYYAVDLREKMEGDNAMLLARHDSMTQSNARIAGAIESASAGKTTPAPSTQRRNTAG